MSTQSAVALDSRRSTCGRATHPGPVDTLIIPGGFGIRAVIDDAAAVAAIAALIDRSTRLVTVCSGALIAAATGALDGHRVTTHWTRAATLAERWPASMSTPIRSSFAASRPPTAPTHARCGRRRASPPGST